MEIEVLFPHRGREAVALFEISGGQRLAPAGAGLPADFADIEINLLGVTYENTSEVIPEAEIVTMYDRLEDEAVECYLDAQ